jgi:hypothetical protein
MFARRIGMRLSSGPPWNLECDVEPIGNDYLCRIHGGDRHVGAVALSQWRSNRATTECLTASGHKEEGIAVQAAHGLCTASRRRVSCIAGIHFDSLNRIEIEAIVQAVHSLTRQAAEQLEHQRLGNAFPASVVGRAASNSKEGVGMVGSAIRNLERAKRLIQLLDEHSYSRSDTGPYYSSVGGHLRHVLDVFACIIRGKASGTVDMTDRRRGTAAETDPEAGLNYLNSVIQDLSRLERVDPSTPVMMVDDLGAGRTEIPSTIGAALCQAHSHAIHHFACIGYILHLQGVELPDSRFGYNPTTPLVPSGSSADRR